MDKQQEAPTSREARAGRAAFAGEPDAQPRGWGDRLAGTLALDRATLRAIADDPGATAGALVTVVAATLLAGMGGLLWTQWGGRTPAHAIYETDIPRFVIRSVVVGGAIQIGLWFAMVLVTQWYLRAFGVAVSLGRLVRVLGYAAAPLALELFVFPPGLEYAAGAVALGYTFAVMVAAVQEAAGTTPGRAVVSMLAGFALFVIVLSLLGSGTTDLAPGVFALDPLPTSVGYRLVQ